MTRNIQLSYPSRLSHTKKRKRRKKKNKIVTRNIQLSFQKSDQACLLFLVTFYNYPARSIVNKEKRKKNKNKIVTRNIQRPCPDRPSHAKKRKRKKKKNNTVTRNFQLSPIQRSQKEKRRRKKQNSDENVLKLSFWKSDLVCLFFLVTFYNYPARSIVDIEKRKERRKNKKVTRNFQLSCPSQPSHAKKEKTKRKKNKIVTRNIQRS